MVLEILFRYLLIPTPGSTTIRALVEDRLRVVLFLFFTFAQWLNTILTAVVLLLEERCNVKRNERIGINKEGGSILILKNVSLIYFNIHRRVFVYARIRSYVFACVQERHAM